MIAWLDATSGVSGDKFLAALLDLGLDPEELTRQLGSLGIEGWGIEVTEEHRRGFRGLGVRVRVEREQPARDWCSIRATIEGADLPSAVAERALAVFGALAQAEARIHGVDVEHVHFHEVGGVDSIVDVVGVCVGLHALDVDRLVVSRVGTGSGTVATEHGMLPVPAPATALLLEGVPVESRDVEMELTTPTGAALVATLADGFGGIPPMTPRATGHGAGARDPELPNILRIIAGEEPTDSQDETVVALKAVIDHRTPEELAHALDAVRGHGALDAWQTPIVMKKGRAGVQVTVLATPELAEPVADAMIRETGTLGVRREFVERRVAPRAVATLDTSSGPVRFKIATVDGHRFVRPEADDVARIATEGGEPAHAIAARLTREAEDLLD